MGGTVPADEVREEAGTMPVNVLREDVDPVRAGGRHAAPRKPLLNRLHVPAGKAIAIVAMPSAVLMGMGLTPQLASAKSLPKSPFKPGPCVSQPDEGDKTARETKEQKAEQRKNKEKVEAAKEKAEAKKKAEKKKEEAEKKEEAKKSGKSGKDSSDSSSSSPSGKPSPSASDSSGSSSDDGSGKGGGLLGDTLDGLLGSKKGDSSASPSSSPSPSASDSSADAKSSESSSPKSSESSESAGAKSHSGGVVGKVGDDLKESTGKLGKGVRKAANDVAHGGLDAVTGGGKNGTGVHANSKEAYPCPEYRKDGGTDDQTPATLPNDPWTLHASSLSLHSLDYKGVVNIKTANGKTKQALKFTANALDIGDLHQIVHGPDGTTYHVQAAKGSTSTIRGGKVTLYTQELKGNLFGLVPIVFDPEHPPPLNIPEAYFTRVTVVQAGQFGGNLTIPGLHQYVQ
jgi:hypothetical protein